jgi:hypothetical protein
LAEFATVAYEIRCTLEGVDQEYMLQRLTLLSSLAIPTDASEAAQRACLPAVSGVKFGSLVNYGADLDFGLPGTAGDGCPIWCRKPWMHDEGMINILPRKGGTKGKADWEILLCLPMKIIAFMLGPEEFGQFVERCVHDRDPGKFSKRKTQFPGRRRINLEGTDGRLHFWKRARYSIPRCNVFKIAVFGAAPSRQSNRPVTAALLIGHLG